MEFKEENLKQNDQATTLVNQKQEKLSQSEDEQGLNCILCCQNLEFIGIYQCNHGPFCYQCVYKMRNLSFSKKCPLCQKEKGCYTQNQKSMEAILNIDSFVCNFSNCSEKYVFQSINHLKRHLKEWHQKYFCDICLDNKCCLLKQQILYSRTALDKHLKQGDLDDEGFIIFFHPYCVFCDSIYYDEEQFYDHMNNHFTCFLCGVAKRFIFYKDYTNLEKHFRITHFLCEDLNCQAESYKVFKTAKELDYHNKTCHENISFKNLDFLAGFSFNDQTQVSQYKVKEDGAIRDKEGVDFQIQFLSEQKQKTMLNCTMEQEDELFDFRELYILKYDQDIDQNEAFSKILSLESYRQISNNQQNSQKEEYYYKYYKGKLKDPYLEDLRFFLYNPIYQLEDNLFNQKIENLFNQEQWDSYHENKMLFFRKKITPKQFFEKFLELVEPIIGFKLLPFFIRTIQNQATCAELDKLYLKELYRLPKKVFNMINQSESYSEFFKIFREEIEKNLKQRIEEKRLSMKRKIKMDKERIYQLIEVLRRVSPKEMTKLKFITNFGFSLDGIQFILMKVYFCPLDKLQSKLSQIPTKEFLKLYLYISICDDMMQGRYFKKEIDQISSLLLKDFFLKNEQLTQKYCQKYKSNLSDYSQAEDDDQFNGKQTIDKTQKKNLNQQFPVLAQKDDTNTESITDLIYKKSSGSPSKKQSNKQNNTSVKENEENLVDVEVNSNIKSESQQQNQINFILDQDLQSQLIITAITTDEHEKSNQQKQEFENNNKNNQIIFNLDNNQDNFQKETIEQTSDQQNKELVNIETSLNQTDNNQIQTNDKFIQKEENQNEIQVNQTNNQLIQSNTPIEHPENKMINYDLNLIVNENYGMEQIVSDKSPQNTQTSKRKQKKKAEYQENKPQEKNFLERLFEESKNAKLKIQQEKQRQLELKLQQQLKNQPIKKSIFDDDSDEENK